MKRSLINAAILGVLGLGAVSAASAETATIELCAGEYVIPGSTATPGPVGNTAPITMWGYAEGGTSTTTASGCVNTPTSPGPSILLPNSTHGESVNYDMNITLHNQLPRRTSLVIPGLSMPSAAGSPTQMAPETFTAPDGSTRVYSFTGTVASGGSLTYHWASVPAGSYLYQSGSHQQIQIQMGLVGALMSNGFVSEGVDGAYTSAPYTSLYPLIYSEIDPVIHDGVVNNQYTSPVDVADGLVAMADMQSTIGYAPKYFGITLDTNTVCAEDTQCFQTARSSTFNGDNVFLGTTNGASPMFRMFNASTRIHTPTLIGGNFNVIAEDGHLYPNPRRQYAVALPPLKSKDAVLDTSDLGAGGGVIRLTDSAMNLSNPAPDTFGITAAQAANDVKDNGEGNVYAEIHVDSTQHYKDTYVAFSEDSSPIARRDEVVVVEGKSAQVDVLENDETHGLTAADAALTVEIVTAPKHGEATLNGGLVTYTHDNGESKRDSLLYRLGIAGQPSSMAAVEFNVDVVNDPPTANPDTASVKHRKLLEIRPLINDTDPEGDKLAIISASTTSDLLTIEDVSDLAVTVRAGRSVGVATVNYTVSDGKGGEDSSTIEVTITKGNGESERYTGGGKGDDDKKESVIKELPPVAVGETIRVVEGGSYNTSGNALLGVLTNDKVNGGTISIAEYPKHGKLNMEDDGSFEYEHNGDSEEADSFKYTIANKAGSSTAEVIINVEARKSAPRVNDDRARVRPGEAVEIDVLRNDKDSDGDVRASGIEITKQPANGVVSITAENKVLYTPNTGFSGKDDFKYRLLDANVAGLTSRRDARVKVRVK